MAAALLDILLAIVTLNVGYAIWSIVVMFNGQTPAQQLLKMKCVHLGDHETAGWWRMVGRGFGRTAVLAVTAVAEFQAISLGTATAAGRALEIGAVVWLLGALFWCFLDRGRQQLWDKLANTVVVDDPERVV